MPQETTSPKHKAYHKIRQFKDCLKGQILRSQYIGLDDEGRPLYDKEAELPTLTFNGTCKVHGTNAGVRRLEDGTLVPQKRTATCGGKYGHFGFVEFVLGSQPVFNKMFDDLATEHGITNATIFGEWAGTGVQKKVGVSRFPKFFYIFEVYDHEKEAWCSDEVTKSIKEDYENRIFNAFNFKQFQCKVDLRYPALSFETMERLTLEVEANCPVGERLGEIFDKDITGDNIGEGIVWKCGEVIFKTKGGKHSKSGGASKMPTTDPIKAANIKEFVDQTLTESRLEQCFDCVGEEVGEVRMEHIGNLMRWIFNDILEEEGDALVANNLCKKDIGGAVANTARPWFIKKINSF